MSLAELITSGRRLAFVGLAKHTGKTEALTFVLRELTAAGHSVGVTSIGRDGERCDVLDISIDKPRITLPRGSLVATTGKLLRSAAVAHEVLAKTEARTPMGRVVIARLLVSGAVEIAGPSAAEQVRNVIETMLAQDVEQVLIDGAIDRRAASSPTVSDGLVMATGAALGTDIEAVVRRTRNAVELVRLPQISDQTEIGGRIHAIAASEDASTLLVRETRQPVILDPRFMLTACNYQIGELLHAYPDATHLITRGAVCERFLKSFARVGHGRRLQLVVADATKVFISRRSYRWYESKGISIRVLAPLHLHALTVNPTAPYAPGFDSGYLRARLQAEIPNLPIIDVRDQEHALVTAA